MYTQVYSYQNKEEIHVTISLVSATGQMFMACIINTFFHYPFNPSFAF